MQQWIIRQNHVFSPFKTQFQQLLFGTGNDTDAWSFFFIYFFYMNINLQLKIKKKQQKTFTRHLSTWGCLGQT